MEFTIVSDGIMSDAGFIIGDLDAEHIRYQAPGLSLTLRVYRRSPREMQIKINDLAVWDPPDCDEALTIQDKARLKRFISAAYKFAGIDVRFDD